jgi:L-threonylcarbamoyladenylate synthase
MPNHPFALALLRAAGPLAVTSANISERENPQDAGEVRSQLEGRVDLILDGGKLRGGMASTIINCMGVEPKLLREGPIAFEDILALWAAE